jgi:hypothetical protein
MAEIAPIDPPPEDAAARDRRVYLDMIVDLRAQTARTVAGLEADKARMAAENWRLIQQAAARDAPPQTWRPLKAAAADVDEPYQNVLGWCKQGVIVAELRGGRWYVRMDSPLAHVTAKRGK